MSLQTPILVSNNIYSSTNYSCSVIDANENIYTSMSINSDPNYGAIQKTDTLGITTLFLQLNSGNTPMSTSTPNYPTGMCFDSTRSTLYYLVYRNGYIYKITDFTTANPTRVNTTVTGPNSFAPFRIIINKLNPNMFYISNLTAYNGSYYVFSYTNNTTTGVYNTVFNLSFPTLYGSSYGLVQDFTGLNFYIGISNGRILKGSGTSVSLWLTLPQSAPVVGLIFNTKYTLFANTDNGYGYLINIDPTTGAGTYQLYYNNTAAILGGLGLNQSSIYLYGISSTQLWKINSILPTGYNFFYNSVERDFAEIFDQSNPGSIMTNYKSAAYGNLDLGQIFTLGNSLIPTNYTNSANVDLGNIFKQKGIPVITTPIYCYKQAIISWTNTDVPNYYILYRDNVQIQNPAITPYTDLNLTNGVTYIYTVTAVYSDRLATSVPFSSNQPATVTYFNYTGGKTSTPNGLYSNIYLTSSGTLTYSCPTQITGINVVVVGGGGGGGAGDEGFTNPNSRYGGGGGGGGEIKIVSPITINTSTTISAIIGSGGAGGYTSPGTGGSGLSTTFTYNNVSTTSTFGTGGLKGSLYYVNNFGVGGGTTTATSFFGGNGGNGQKTGGITGGNSDYFNSTGVRYGGGGGGSGFTAIFQGGGGGNGSGGQGGYYELSLYDGQPGQAYGGGGGGGCQADYIYGAGGAGANGVVVLTVLN
jgi:hypothetical protein